jgi:hypothetical protein
MPLGRIADAAEQASVLAFMNSADASYISGQVLWVDGGYLAGVATDQLPHATGSAGAPPASPPEDKRTGANE